MRYTKKGIPIYEYLEELPVSLDKNEPVISRFHKKPMSRVFRVNETIIAKRRSLSREFKAHREASIMKNMFEEKIPVPKLLGLFYADSDVLLISEYVQGKNLMELLYDSNTNEDIMRQVGFEIGRMFKKGYVHGDLAPYHILIEDDEIHFIDLERGKKASNLSAFCKDIDYLINSGWNGWPVSFSKKAKTYLLDGISESFENPKYLIKIKESIFDK